MLDLTPATDMLAAVVAGVRDDQLAGPTPCERASVGDLLDHVDGLAAAFTAAAAKTAPEGGQGPTADASRLGPDWRARIPERLAELARAWQDPAAWAGMTRAGGLDMPAEVSGVVALDEVIVHGWDIAVSTGQQFRPDPDLVAAARGFVQSAVAERPEGTPGLFGPPVPVPPDAPAIDQLVGLTGRDPAWRPGGR